MYVIAGVTGHVGGVCASSLLARKKPVTVIVRDAKKGESWAKKGAKVAVGTLDDEAFLAATLKGAEGFFVLLPPNFAAPDFFGAQRATSDHIAAAVKASGIKHVVMLSSVGADLAEGNGPIRGLHYLENKLRAAGTKLSALRPGYFQENVDNAKAPAQQAGIFPNFMASADYPVPMIATKDIGELAAELLLGGAKSEVVDLHGPSYTIRQVAELLGKKLGKALKVVDIPAAGHVEAMTKAGFPESAAKVFAEMYAGFAKGIITPKGDRLVQGKTTLEETLA
jgi:uncharacterized protein YbjT (DUF2867 family)